MTQEEQINKILEIEQKIVDKQQSKFSAHTLMPVSMVLTVIGFSFAIGCAWQISLQTQSDLAEFKKSYREDQVKFSGQFDAFAIKLEKLNDNISDVRVLLVGQQNAVGKK